MTLRFSSSDGIKAWDDTAQRWVDAVPEPYHFRIIPGLWKRLTGWRDEYGRRASIDWAFWERDI